MPTSTQPAAKFVYFIPPPAISKAIPLASAAFLLCLLAYLIFKAGFWLPPVGMLGPLIVFFFLLAFQPRSWLARLEFERRCVRRIPLPPLRWIGEPSTEISLGAQTREILLCRGSSDNSFYGWSGQGNFPYGFRVIVRSIHGNDHTLKVSGDRLGAHQACVLLEGITGATSLPVRLVQRDFGSDGSFKEAPWTPAGNLVQLSGIAEMLFAATPFIAGIVVGALRPDSAIVVAVGIMLWLCQTLALFAFAKFSNRKPTMFARLYWLTTSFTFSVSYTVIYFLVSSIARTPTQ